ncbi:hypothetical protein SCHPADRAFT_927779 [Schizopora paradoxa]|uniref:Uncharacterized protein n=1 Tax=Schizopora paradoxa TaxID=27342 RepID=A0A0H2RYR1_9AGAM|nr:hypothetical protein SCHPADRAFT_927779 [Schizopora paradoxa]
MSSTSFRDRHGREWFLAPEPPKDEKGNMQYGFPVSAQAIDAAAREAWGDEKQNAANTQYYFWCACRSAAKSSRPLYMGVRRDIKIEKIPGHPLNGLVFGIASNKSWETRILPRNDEIARLKKVLQTDAEPEWFRVV